MLGGGNVVTVGVRRGRRCMLLKGNIKFKGGIDRHFRTPTSYALCELTRRARHNSTGRLTGDMTPRFLRVTSRVLERTRGAFKSAVSEEVLFPLTSRVSFTMKHVQGRRRVDGPLASSVGILFCDRFGITRELGGVLGRQVSVRVSRRRIKCITLRVRSTLKSRGISITVRATEAMQRYVTVVRVTAKEGVSIVSLSCGHVVGRVGCVMTHISAKRALGLSVGRCVRRGCPRSCEVTRSIYRDLNGDLNGRLSPVRVNCLTVRVREAIRRWTWVTSRSREFARWVR